MTAETQRINLRGYLERIGYNRMPAVDLPTLKGLLSHHVRTIPFENVTSFLGGAVDIEISAIEDKLVRHLRGGYCFEQNALLRAALQQIGFAVIGLAARVLWQTPVGHQPAQSHMILLVEVDEVPYLLDAGFGSNTLTAPMRLDSTDLQTTPHGTYRLTRTDNRDYLLQVKVEGVWQAMYSFDLSPRTAGDYKIANWYCCTHRESRFVEHLIAARAFSEGRHALINRQLSYQPIIGPKSVIMLANVKELRQTLLDVFGIEVPTGAEVDRRLASIFQGQPFHQGTKNVGATISRVAS
ncbi:arylamine N-acetyltransferase [Microbulbifer sp. VTAC004]|uniref:arylamine N-acetyltransferase family protein n=1 Tax=Microbulbifer TaxID=48073 RepID=UPI00036E5CCF|nr:arylamine N-acetyltransferase [Microbulbifer variabilis]